MKKDKQKIKENPIMVKQNTTKNIKMGDSDGNEVKSFLIILGIIVLLVGIVYGTTELLKEKKDEGTPALTEGEINYDKITVGMLLNRPYDNYYVLVYNASEKDAALYSTILSNYMAKSKEKGYIKIYFCDLHNKLNNAYYNVNNDNKSNPNAKNIEDLDFGDLTLIKVEKGKITKYIEDFNKVKELLKLK